MQVSRDRSASADRLPCEDVSRSDGRLEVAGKTKRAVNNPLTVHGPQYPSLLPKRVGQSITSFVFAA
jgi:hypothetical protein